LKIPRWGLISGIQSPSTKKPARSSSAVITPPALKRWICATRCQSNMRVDGILTHRLIQLDMKIWAGQEPLLPRFRRNAAIVVPSSGRSPSAGSRRACRYQYRALARSPSMRCSQAWAHAPSWLVSSGRCGEQPPNCRRIPGLHVVKKDSDVCIHDMFLAELKLPVHPSCTGALYATVLLTAW